MKTVIEGQKRLFDGFLKVDAAMVQYERFDGRMSRPRLLLCLERGDSVAALIYNADEKKVILVKQFRYPTLRKGPGWIVELMAGMVADGEEPHQALERELLEEVGYQPNVYQPISTFYTSPGGSSERIHLFFVIVHNEDRVAKGGGVEDEDEDLQYVEYTLEELAKTPFEDAKTLVAVQWFLAGQRSLV